MTIRRHKQIMDGPGRHRAYSSFHSLVMLSQFQILLLWLSWASVTPSLPDVRKFSRRTKKWPSIGLCRPETVHFHSYGQWATKRNHSHHHLSLLTPSLPRVTMRRILEEDLGKSPILAGNTACPLLPTRNSDEHTMRRSICPWYWRVNYDPKR